MPVRTAAAPAVKLDGDRPDARPGSPPRHVLIAAPLVLAASRPPAQEADPLLTDAQRDRIRDRPVVRFTVSFEARPFLFL